VQVQNAGREAVRATHKESPLLAAFDKVHQKVATKENNGQDEEDENDEKDAFGLHVPVRTVVGAHHTICWDLPICLGRIFDEFDDITIFTTIQSEPVKHTHTAQHSFRARELVTLHGRIAKDPPANRVEKYFEQPSSGPRFDFTGQPSQAGLQESSKVARMA
jgi:hypothetical protein